MQSPSAKFKTPLWPLNSVVAFSTTNSHPKNPLSSEVNAYGAFNLGLHVGDIESSVAKNRQVLTDYLPKHVKIQWLDQIHSNKVVNVSQQQSTPIQADAAVTTNKNVALAVMTADCLPILISSDDGAEIAAIHGGWRPLASNIIANTLNALSTNNCNLKVWLGPCIGENAFEVGGEVRLNFIEQDAELATAFKPTGNNKYFADLRAIVRRQLSTAGVYDVFCSNDCTFTQYAEFYSYRRQQVTGRMATIICIKDDDNASL